MTKEEWKPLTEAPYNKFYQVSNLGRVKMIDHILTFKNGRQRHYPEHVLKPTVNSSGYVVYHLSINQHHAWRTGHSLVAKAFITNDDPNKTEINHIDEDKTNNNVKNLEWCSHEYNINYGTRNERVRNSNINTHNAMDSIPVKAWNDKGFEKEFSSMKEACRYFKIDIKLIQNRIQKNNDVSYYRRIPGMKFEFINKAHK